MELQNCCDYCKYSYMDYSEKPVCKCFAKPISLSDYCSAWEERKHTCVECVYYLCDGMCNVQHKEEVFEGSAACSEFRKMKE